MVYKKPTYEEYLKASQYAKIRYRYGVFIQTVATILLFILLFYTVTNIEEMRANPIGYAEEKLGVICYSPQGTQFINDNGIDGNITGIEKEW